MMARVNIFFFFVVLCLSCNSTAVLDEGDNSQTPNLVPLHQQQHDAAINISNQEQDSIGRSRTNQKQHDSARSRSNQQQHDSARSRNNQHQHDSARSRIQFSEISAVSKDAEFVGDRQEAAVVLDLSKVNGVDKLVIDDENRADVIVASSSNCSLQSLEVTVPHLISSSVGDNCKKLSIINMTGGGWDCSWAGWPWLKLWHEQAGHENMQPTAECQDLPAVCNNTLGDFSTGLFYQMACKEGIHRCQPCTCRFQYSAKDAVFLATVECSGKNLTNQDVPTTLPRTADFFSFDYNRLSDVTALLEQTRDMPYLKVINLNNNLLEEVPALPPHHAANLSLISLANNNIKQLRGPALDVYFNRSVDFGLYIKGNPLECNCQFYEISTDLKTHDKKRSVLRLFPDFLYITCVGGSLPKLYHHHSCPSSPLRSLLFPHLLTDLGIVALAGANIAFMVLAVDLQIAIYQLKRGYSQPRIPWIHVLYMFLSRLPKRFCQQRATKASSHELGRLAVADEDDLDDRFRRHSS